MAPEWRLLLYRIFVGNRFPDVPKTFKGGQRALWPGSIFLTVCIVLIGLSILPAPVAATDYPDLDITFVAVNAGGATANYGFTYSINPVSVTVKNIGATSSPAGVLRLGSSDGFTGTGTIPALAAGGSATVIITDTTIRTTDGLKVTYTATADPGNLIAESDETNNGYTKSNIPFSFNGYKGKGLYRQGGNDVTTKKTFDVYGGFAHSFGNSYYRSGSYSNGWYTYDVTWKWNAANVSKPAYFELDVPANATVKAARLYMPYTWDLPNDTEHRGYSMPDNVTVSFNGNDISSAYDGWYWDRGNFGEWGPYTYGLVTYDVTSSYRKNATNTLHFTRQGRVDKLSLYGMTLLVVYENPAETRQQIFLNEEFDLLGADYKNYKTTEPESIAYVPFLGPTIDTAKVKRANLTTFVPSGDSDEGNLLLGDGTVIASNVWNYGADGQPVGENGYPQVAVDVRDVASYLKSTGNVFGIQSTAWASQPCMAASQQVLAVEYYKAPVAGFAAGSTSGTAPMTVQFTDQSGNDPTSWAWTFGDGGSSAEQNPTHTYTSTGTYTVTLTATNAGGSDSETKADYITVSSGSAVIAIPGQTNVPTDPDGDGLYEDLNGNGVKETNDVVLFFKNLKWIGSNEPVAAFDFNGNDAIETNDVIILFKKKIT